ncbi:hypothetical protein R1flu_013062 [Riccia fluitans]|uniref:Uncharacterized protein n=1 Tax=Riccia fluitans TaxID=41844 RepID=A0ABD1ZCK0_9MARC
MFVGHIGRATYCEDEREGMRRGVLRLPVPLPINSHHRVFGWAFPSDKYRDVKTFQLSLCGNGAGPFLAQGRASATMSQEERKMALNDPAA